MEEQWTVLKVLQWTAQYFASKGLSGSRADAEVLLAHVLGVERIQLYLNHDKPLAPEELALYRQLIRRRTSFEPVQYIVGRQEFWSLPFEVTPDVLIPRPETEVLVERALELIGSRPALVLDLGTGSGAIAVALAHERSEVRVLATDLSYPALAMAKRNARRNGVADRISFALSDLFDALADRPLFDVIASNPPYISEADFPGLAPEITRHEPHCALRAGLQGLDIVRSIIAQFRSRLKPGGSLLMEIGQGQADILEKELAPDFPGAFDFMEDYSGIRRVLHVTVSR
ncbi:MAG: peptide chain release factor N(5)-glutamine methyltransferase [Desulfobacteraceae bacterium]|nr:peptide chain release factor N(5)-glutamine methyltransferase [Desulfobacteraceae bacterium]